MKIPPPTDGQARILWYSLTALAVGILLGLIGVLIWGFVIVLSKLSAVILPLALAAIIAYLLDPLVDLCEKRFSRAWSVTLVFLFGSLLVIGLLGTVVPRLIVETQQLVHRVPEYMQHTQERMTKWLSQSRWADRLNRHHSPAETPGRKRDQRSSNNKRCFGPDQCAGDREHQPGQRSRDRAAQRS